jgi:3-phenylpropionate/cinnamic acid dioxygenase small subunit
MNIELHHEIHHFLVQEARLIDERRFDDWLALFTEDARYCMLGSATRESGNPVGSEKNELALVEDDRRGLELRVRRLGTGLAYAEQPPSRTRHLITNIEVEGGGTDSEVTVFSNFILYKSRLERDEEFFVGRREDVLKRVNGGWRIARRKIVLDHNVIPGKSLSVFF